MLLVTDGEVVTIAGNVVMPFFTKAHEGFDVNSSYDWQLAERLVKIGAARLPDTSQSPYVIKNYP